ncbi:MAG TPA: hypothetical protein VJ742_12760 [Nitrososphaera sp.]|nr:hypothetical protein [Nitrososphaera sp.]
MEETPDNDFYEDDEPIEDVKAAWLRGEPGKTVGPLNLSPEEEAIVESALKDFTEALKNISPEHRIAADLMAALEVLDIRGFVTVQEYKEVPGGPILEMTITPAEAAKLAEILNAKNMR